MQVVRPIAHAATIERLWLAARAGRLPHALLFEGPEGIGKFAAALWFAMGCLCARGPGEPCQSCGPCRRVSSGGERGNHPDLFLIDPLLEEEERILLGRIAQRDSEGPGAPQSLEAFLDLRPLEASLRPVLIREAQRMNPNAQNALLKTLEEPRAGTVIVLETQRSAALLATIKSRCIRLRFSAPDAEQCAELLAAAGLVPEAARELARLAEGSPGVALRMARNGTREILRVLAEVARGAREPLSAAAALAEIEAEYPGKTQTARERERTRVVLDLLSGIVRDAWRLHAGQPAHDLPHGASATALAARADARELAQRGEQLLEVRADVERNLQPGALLEQALLLLGEGVLPPGGVRRG